MDIKSAIAALIRMMIETNFHVTTSNILGGEEVWWTYAWDDDAFFNETVEEKKRRKLCTLPTISGF